MEIIVKCSDDLRGSKNVFGESIQEIVRCKECVHKFVDRTNNVSFNCCELNHNKVQPDDWFCADGERRSE